MLLIPNMLVRTAAVREYSLAIDPTAKLRPPFQAFMNSDGLSIRSGPAFQGVFFVLVGVRQDVLRWIWWRLPAGDARWRKHSMC